MLRYLEKLRDLHRGNCCVCEILVVSGAFWSVWLLALEFPRPLRGVFFRFTYFRPTKSPLSPGRGSLGHVGLAANEEIAYASPRNLEIFHNSQTPIIWSLLISVSQKPYLSIVGGYASIHCHLHHLGALPQSRNARWRAICRQKWNHPTQMRAEQHPDLNPRKLRRLPIQDTKAVFAQDASYAELARLSAMSNVPPVKNAPD